MPFFSCLSFIIICHFLDGSKKTLHDIFAFNSFSSQIEHIYKKYKHKGKKNTKCEGPTNKSTKAPKYF